MDHTGNGREACRRTNQKRKIYQEMRGTQQCLKTRIYGFANAQGGRIYIGCDDNGHIIGLDNTRKLLEDIPNKVRNAMSIVVDVNRLEEDGKEYIEIVVPPYPVAISCKGVYYYRSGSTMQTLSGPELESLSGSLAHTPRSDFLKRMLTFVIRMKSMVQF